VPDNLSAEEKLRMLISMLRASIDIDWAKLAAPLAEDERRTTTRRLAASTKALKVMRNISQPSC
jgi:hypothetical protein